MRSAAKLLSALLLDAVVAAMVVGLIALLK